MEESVEKALMWVPNKSLMDTAVAALPPPFDFRVDSAPIKSRDWRTEVGVYYSMFGGVD